MLPMTGEALLILLSTVLPGAMFTFAYERQVGAYKPPVADRLLRYVAMSVLFDLMYAPPLYLMRGTALGGGFEPSRFVLLWVGIVVGLGIPAVLGTVVGGLFATRDTREEWRRVRRLLSARGERRLLDVAVGTPTPRAWDHVFNRRTQAFVRIRLNGTLIGGRFGSASYAARFPHDGDLYLEEVWPIDATGTFGGTSLGYGLYVAASTISSIEIVPLPRQKEASHV